MREQKYDNSCIGEETIPSGLDALSRKYTTKKEKNMNEHNGMILKIKQRKIKIK